MRTAKGGTTRKGPDFPAFWEAVLAALLLIGAVVVVVTNYKQIREIYIFAVVLVVQSLPFLAAVAIAALEGTRFNEFAYWRSIEARLVGAAAAARTIKAACSGARLSDTCGRQRDIASSGSAVSTSRTQYDVPIGITSSLKS